MLHNHTHKLSIAKKGAIEEITPKKGHERETEFAEAIWKWDEKGIPGDGKDMNKKHQCM